MSKIIVVGGEDFTLGFELIGIEAKPVSEIEKVISKSEDTGIVIIREEDFKSLSVKLKNQIERLLKPIVVVLSEDDIKGNSLKEKIIRAFGVDLMK